MWEVLPQIPGKHGLEPWADSLNPTLPLCIIVKIVTVSEPNKDDDDDDDEAVLFVLAEKKGGRKYGYLKVV